MKIVFLNSYYLNIDSAIRQEWSQFGEVSIYEKIKNDEILEKAQDADIILTPYLTTSLNRDVLAALPKLRYIGLFCTGFNHVDIQYAREKNIVVSNIPDYSSTSVAQMAFALLLELTNQVGNFNRITHEGLWNKTFDHSLYGGHTELESLTMGIIGFGAIGKKVAHIASGFGMNVLIHTRTIPKQSEYTFCELDHLFQKSDALSLHCPLNEKTKELINAQRLALMKPSAYLINTSRGAIIDETALADALNHDRLAGAGLDILANEPPGLNSPLFQAKNCIITPHMGWASKEAHHRLLKIGTENLKAFISGKPVNVVS